MKPHIKRHPSGFWMIYLSRNDHVPLVAGKCVYEAWREYEHWFSRSKPLEPKHSPCCKTFKSEACGYVGCAVSCNKSLGNCRLLGNEISFGGWVGK